MRGKTKKKEKNEWKVHFAYVRVIDLLKKNTSFVLEKKRSIGLIIFT